MKDYYLWFLIVFILVCCCIICYRSCDNPHDQNIGQSVFIKINHGVIGITRHCEQSEAIPISGAYKIEPLNFELV
jgi:hypothetical protein